VILKGKDGVNKSLRRLIEGDRDGPKGRTLGHLGTPDIHVFGSGDGSDCIVVAVAATAA
jgi:hypothetical protein